MAAVNLIRNSRVFFTTNLDSSGRVKIGALKDAASGMSTTNCFEIQVLEGMSFSQNTSVDTVTLSEAGATPVRGQRSFNTALEPVDFSFSTYMRPRNTGTAITCEENVLWNAFAGVGAIGSTNPQAAWTEASSTATLSFTQSNKHQLQAFGLIILFDNAGYVIDNCALDSATIDFGIDAIAAIAWAGKGSAIRVLTDAQANTASPVVFAGTDFDNTAPDQATAKNTSARYITNKLSTLIVNDGINDFLLTGGVGSVYTIALTGGNITFNNNLTYLTPANLGTVNLPITYFTGTRAITGTINAYLKTGTLESGGLLNDLLAGAATTVDPKFTINVQLGGPSTNLTGVEIKLPAAMLQIPTINTEQVISTTINFTAQAYTGTGYDITQSNEATIVYRAAV
jgi:hypothetical protein